MLPAGRARYQESREACHWEKIQRKATPYNQFVGREVRRLNADAAERKKHGLTSHKAVFKYVTTVLWPKHKSGAAPETPRRPRRKAAEVAEARNRRDNRTYSRGPARFIDREAVEA